MRGWQIIKQSLFFFLTIGLSFAHAQTKSEECVKAAGVSLEADFRKLSPSVNNEVSAPFIGDACKSGRAGNDYLEADLEKIFQNGSLGEPKLKFPIECIYASMKGVAISEPIYRTCKADGKRIANFKTRQPCLSQNYVRYVHDTFLKVMDCADLDPYEIFPLVSEESGFQVNIGRGGSGIGQMNDSSIAWMNQEDRVNKLLQDRPEQCKPVVDLLKKFDQTPITKIESDCHYTQLPYNPALALVYFAAFYNRARAQVESMVTKWSKGKYSDGDLKKIISWLTRDCYTAEPNCNLILREFPRTVSNRTSMGAMKNQITNVILHAGAKAETEQGKKEVYGGHPKEMVASFHYKVDKTMEHLDGLKQLTPLDYSKICGQ